MGDHMCSQRFILLLVWCGLLSVAVLFISVTQLNSRQVTQDQETLIQFNSAKDDNMQQNEPESQLALPRSTAGRSLSHIHLTMLDSNLTMEDVLPSRFSNTSRALVLRNNSVYINTGGFYHFYAHVTFDLVSGRRTVTLIRNAIPDLVSERPLGEAVDWGEREGSISISQTISCQRGWSLRLEISPRTIRHNAENTYWGLFLLTPH